MKYWMVVHDDDDDDDVIWTQSDCFGPEQGDKLWSVQNEINASLAESSASMWKFERKGISFDDVVAIECVALCFCMRVPVSVCIGIAIDRASTT